MQRYIGLDFETFSKVDLRRHGLDRYVNDPSFTPLIASTDEDFARGGPHTFDFVYFGDEAKDRFLNHFHHEVDLGATVTAQNVGFERAVLRTMNVKEKYLEKILDSAVVARCQGASSHLEAAAPQLTDQAKLDYGLHLIKLFCVPNEWNGGVAPTKDLLEASPHSGWDKFKDYCEQDARASRAIVETYALQDSFSTRQERGYELLTARMNERGWKVDLDLVHEMQSRFLANVEQAEADFRARYDPAGELRETFFNSPIQLKAWCAERKVRATSFDADHVEALQAKLAEKLATLSFTDPRYAAYDEVNAMLLTKIVIGGSSLKKLQTIIDTTGTDGRLRNQYMHVGAGQSYRTSGRGVQMQNLKKLPPEPLNMETLYDLDQGASNDTLAENLRQVFTSSDPHGVLMVGDFASVESRGLAFLAGAEWKLTAYRNGQDMYKVLASQIYNVDYTDVTKPQRQTGKVGELSCGYGAGPESVKNFAHGYGLELTEAEALQLVRDWRGTNPEIVDLWGRLDDALQLAVSSRQVQLIGLANDMRLIFRPGTPPPSLLAQHPGAVSVSMELAHSNGTKIMERMFHGCYVRSRNICYYKPSDRKTGELWNASFIDPKTKKVRYFDLYGGKIAGILTQSFCRELFFMSMSELSKTLTAVDNAAMVGQFHDEIVVDWVPGNLSQAGLEAIMQTCMTTLPPLFRGFPLGAEIKHGYRYIK